MWVTVIRAGPPPAATVSDLRILVIDENPIRRAIPEAGLQEAGFRGRYRAGDATGLLDRIYMIDPDVVVIDLENPSRDVLEQMFQVSRIVKRPIAMFVDQSDRATIEAAIEAGVSAYIVDGLRKERVRPILDMTISRFRAFDALRAEPESTKSALKERKLIERAKGLLMKSRKLDEEAAYRLLRRTAMNQNRRVGEVQAASWGATRDNIVLGGGGQRHRRRAYPHADALSDLGRQGDAEQRPDADVYPRPTESGRAGDLSFQRIQEPEGHGRLLGAEGGLRQEEGRGQGSEGRHDLPPAARMTSGSATGSPPAASIRTRTSPPSSCRPRRWSPI